MSPPYQEQFSVGDAVRTASHAELLTFMNQWQFHHPLSREQLHYPDHETTVVEVTFYHGGDPLYVLRGLPGVWHEVCLRRAR